MFSNDIWYQDCLKESKQQAAKTDDELQRALFDVKAKEDMLNDLRDALRWAIVVLFLTITGELFLVPASAPRLVQQRPWYVLSCLWDGAYKRTLAANR